MESGAKGCEVVVSGKLRGQRAKSMKFTDGFMIHSGYPIEEYIDMAVRHVYLRQGMFICFCAQVCMYGPCQYLLHVTDEFIFTILHQTFLIRP